MTLLPNEVYLPLYPQCLKPVGTTNTPALPMYGMVYGLYLLVLPCVWSPSNLRKLALSYFLLYIIYMSGSNMSCVLICGSNT